MFKTSVSATPFTSDVANEFFENIVGRPYQDDVSFLSTIRALVGPKATGEDVISLSFASTSYRTEDLAANSADRVLEAMCTRNPGEPGLFYVHEFRSASQENNQANIALVKSRFEKKYEGYHRLDAVTDFFREAMPVECFINEEIKSVMIFVGCPLDTKKMHYLQCAIRPSMPWYFNPKEPIPQDEMDLIFSLCKKTQDDYMTCISRMAEKYDFRSLKIRRLLKGFETRYERRECTKTRDVIQNCDERIEQYNNAIAELIRKRNEDCIRLMGLEEKIARSGDEENSEIMDYILCNKKIDLEMVNDTEMIFVVRTYLNEYDPEMAERVLENRSSYVYMDPRGRPRSDGAVEKMKKLMRAIFIDRTLRIRFCAAYKLVMNERADARTGYPFSSECETYMPNTHINKYACLGNHKREINQRLVDNDYIGAIEQCVASCGSLNFGDSTVMQAFMDELYTSARSFIELPDGRVVKPAKAIEWLESLEENNEQEETKEG